ncbi:MAG TPA: LemA family protein [candidate division Zixibacteria bacterium]|nr:LemA family protein [candidate division Zixibacteria bacterium]
MAVPILLICLGIFAAAILVLLFVGIGLYNKLIEMRNRAENGWADIDVQLKRRYDLIPNLVETVKSYAGHEKETLENVTKARQQAIEVSGDVAKQAQAENMITGALRQLFALSESYPNLKANENFMHLQAELANIEEVLSQARRYYNAVVRDLNTMIDRVPTNFIAMIFGFKKREYFEIEDESIREAPKVDFSK